MKTNMTDGDKRLLVFMFMFVIIVGIGYWGVYPQIKEYIALSSKIEKEEDKKKINQMKMANLGAVQIMADEYESKLAAVKDDFYQIMTSSEVDRMMTEIAVKNKLEIYDLKFSMPTTPAARLAYKNSDFYYVQKAQIEEFYKKEAAAEKTAKTTKTSSEKENDSDEEIESDKKSSNKTTSLDAIDAMGDEEGGYRPNTDVYAVPVTITVGGEVADIHNFINEFIEMDYDKRLLLVSYSWGEYKVVVKRDANGNIINDEPVVPVTDSETGEGLTEEDIAGEEVVKKTLTIRVEVYMCDTEDVSE